MIARLLAYRSLLLVFVWREYLIRYKQSMLGILWAVVQPLSMMFLFVFVFGTILKVESHGYPFPLFFYSGLLPWAFFSGALNYCIPSLTNHYTLITRIYFPREIIPLAGTAVCLFDFCISALVYFLLLLVYGVKITPSFILLVPLMVELFLFTFAVGLFLAALNVYYRDVRLVSSFLIQLWFFASPVIYSLKDVDSSFKMVLYLNPLTFLIESIRQATLEGTWCDPWYFSLSFAACLLLWYLSYSFFCRVERAFADVI